MATSARTSSPARGVTSGASASSSGRVGTALMTAALELADGWLQLRRVELTVFTDNAPAIRLYKKVGLEGTHKEHAFRDGVFVDACTMARLRPEP